MICQKCNINHATITVTQVINGERTDINLCQECAHDLGLDDPMSEHPSELIKFLLTMISEQEEEKRAEMESIPDITCHNCGMSMMNFHKEGLLGCEICYQEFEDYLKTLIRRYHGTTSHRRIKSFAKLPLSKSAKMVYLQEELSSALEREDFEYAATLRDEIRTLKKSKR